MKKNGVIILTLAAIAAAVYFLSTGRARGAQRDPRVTTGTAGRPASTFDDLFGRVKPLVFANPGASGTSTGASLKLDLSKLFNGFGSAVGNWLGKLNQADPTVSPTTDTARPEKLTPGRELNDPEAGLATPDFGSTDDWYNGGSTDVLESAYDEARSD